MSKPRLGFKLWSRKYLTTFRSKGKSILNNKLETFISLIMTLFAIWLAYTANELTKQSNKFSQTALALSQNDSSQQLQINKLKDILMEIKIQNDIARNQTDALIKVVAETNKINISTNNLIAGSKRQTGLILQQVLLSKRTDSISNANVVLANESDLLKFRKVFEEARDVNMMSRMMKLYLDQTPDISTLTDLRNIFEKGIDNKIFLTDSLIKTEWYTFYQHLKIAEDQIKVFNAQGKPVSKYTNIKNMDKGVRDRYFNCINTIWKRLDFLENIFRKSNVKGF